MLRRRPARRNAGVTPRAVQRWRERGRRDREQRAGDPRVEPSVYERFLEGFERVESESELRLLASIQLAGTEDAKKWTALAWLLERRRPEDYSRRWLPAEGDDGDLGPGHEELVAAMRHAKAALRATVPRPHGSSAD